MPLFALATLTPVALIALAALHGGVWAWAAAGYLGVLVAVLDRLVARQARNADPEAEFPAADALLVALGLGHFALMGLAVAAAGGAGGLAGLDRALVLLAAGMAFGQISHPAAHELIHRPGRGLRLLGRLIYTSLLVGHHASAHLLVHHVHVGTEADPNSPPRGEGFYRFAVRATAGSFRAGLAQETRRRARAGKPVWGHPYLLYVGGGLGLAGASWALAGAAGLAAFIFLGLFAQMQILMSDYVQHYGLRRAKRPDGRPEPVGPQHSWNAPQWFSNAVMLHAPRHSDHHVTPTRPYPALQLDPARMPCLPRPLPVMAALALVPPVWRRIMDRRCERWQVPAADPAQ
ncbi:alkane 1-monooxygenase [Roseovarius salinarum]|uniref:alkane 1-monooxygenase n=1 Tax=Roseovarius salinarum TaxID=1981892 RepID=UPI000C32B8D8|nr:alkane 1-monooxygenase [Roseovarius salinarum]